MKRLKDLTRDELLAEDFDTQKLIEIECAFQGVVIPVMPDYLPIPVIADADVTYYEVNGQLFTTYKDAEGYLGSAMYVDYSSKCPTPLKDKSYYNTITPKTYYSEALYTKNKGLLDLKKANKNKNENLEREYKKICTPYEELTENIYEAIAEHRDEQSRESCQIKIFDSYLDLAEADGAIAVKFYKNAYGELPQYLVDKFDLQEFLEGPDADIVEVKKIGDMTIVGLPNKED